MLLPDPANKGAWIEVDDKRHPGNTIIGEVADVFSLPPAADVWIGSIILDASDGSAYRAVSTFDPMIADTWERFIPGASMNWRGVWAPGDYQKHDVVYDDTWLMIANKDTTERPAPQPTGDPANVYSGSDPTRQDAAKSITFGNRYTFPTTGYLTGWRIWTVVGNSYTVYSVNDPNGAAIVNEFGTITGQGGWQSFSLGEQIIPENTEFDLVCVAQEPDPSPTSFSSDWDYDTPPSATAPVSGQIVHANNAPDTFSIHKFDDGGGDRTLELAGMEIGDIIRGTNLQWAIQAIVDQGTYYDFIVVPAQQESPDGVQTFIFETVSATPITYIEDVDYWTINNPNVQGIIAIEGAAWTINGNAYGVDITYQAANISDDWDLMSKMGGTGGGSSGGELPDNFWVEKAGDTMTGPLEIAAPHQAITLTDDTGLLQVGPSGEQNMGVNRGNIQGRSGGLASAVNVNGLGGRISLGAAGMADYIRVRSEDIRLQGDVLPSSRTAANVVTGAIGGHKRYRSSATSNRTFSFDGNVQPEFAITLGDLHAGAVLTIYANLMVEVNGTGDFGEVFTRLLLNGSNIDTNNIMRWRPARFLGGDIITLNWTWTLERPAATSGDVLQLVLHKSIDNGSVRAVAGSSIEVVTFG